METEGMYYDNPETTISANGKKFSFGEDSVFIVYDSVDLQKPIFLQVSKKNRTMKRHSQITIWMR